MHNFNKIYIGYSEFGDKLIQLYHKILRGGKPSKIVGIANGGLNISKPMAEWLGVHHMSISIHFYNEELKLLNRPHFADVPEIPKDWTNLLIVDDIIDSGTTVQYFQKYSGLKHKINFRIACLHWYPDGKYKIKPDYYIDKKPKNSWIIYPWEKEFTETF